MRFSIATPTFNRLPYLRRCVGSVRNQEGVGLEHLVQDGGSTDGTLEWMATQNDLHAASEPDNGMYDAINRAWDRSTGDVLSWLNTDEQYLPGTLAFVSEYFKAHPEVDIVFGDCLIVDEGGSLLAARREIPLRRWYLAGSFLYSLSCTLFFRNTLQKRTRLRFDSHYRYAGDYDLLLRLLKEGAVCRHVARYFALFGVDGGNISLSPGAEIETREIRKRYGGKTGRGLQLLARACRAMERLASGCYLPDTVSYVYMLDETGRSRVFDHIPGSFRFTYPRALRAMRKKT